MNRTERWDFVREVIETRLIDGLVLAARCLPRFRFVDVARMSLAADASTIRWWVESVVCGLGVEGARDVYDKLKAEGLDGTEKAAYWLGKYGPS